MEEQSNILLITALPLRTAEALELITTALLAHPAVTPTHWGPDERTREPFDAAALIARVSSWTDTFGTPGLQRRKAPRYSGYFTTHADQLNHVKIDAAKSTDAADLAQIFTLADALAAALAVEYGVVNLVRADSPRRCRAAALITALDFQRYGPAGIGARTFLGPRLVQAIGMERLAALELPLQPTAWGGVRFDLHTEPWRANRETLVSQQERVNELLAESGVFGDYRTTRYAPGPNWQPVPITAQQGAQQPNQTP
jgi:hypothetical protein